MAIQVRRGANADFDSSKMLPGELAVTTDGSRKVYAAFQAGDVKELAFKEDGRNIVDDTLTVSGKAADAAAVGKEVSKLSGEIDENDDRLYNKTSMIMDESRNLFDGYAIPNITINASTGEEAASADYRSTRFIKVNPSQDYTIFGWNKYVFYDADRKMISAHYTNNSNRLVITTPENAEWIRLCTSVVFYTQQVYDGNVEASNSTYEHPVLNDDYIDKSVIYSRNNTINLFNGVFVEKTTIDNNTGLETAHDDFRTSEYIAVNPGAYYTAYKWNKVMFYRKDYTFLSWAYCQSTPQFRTPAECYYVRLCTSITKRDQMFMYGDVKGFYYVPHKETISADLIERPIWKDETYFYDKIVGYYNGPEQEAFNPSASDRTVESIYGIYDELVTTYPGYITKTDLGLDQSGSYNIYQYAFKPESPRVPELDSVKNKHLPKIIIFSGVHGLERWSIYAVAQLMKLICTNPNNDPILEYYRYGIEFIILPLVNPWGYVNGTRWNSRGVNINRNFSSGWKVSGTEAFTIDYEGTNPFSENETSIVEKVLQENLDAFAVIDAHTHDITEVAKTYWCIAYQTTDFFRDAVAIARTNISKLSRRMKSGYNQNFEGFAGYVEGTTLHGDLGGQAASKYRFNAMTAECTDKLMGEAESGTALTNQINVEFYANLITEIIKYYQ